MRIWSLHPKLLDTKGFVALWRETILAKHVLEGKTKGYLNHPQLDRFKKSGDPLDSINFYLMEVYKESMSRKYNFDINKFKEVDSLKINVTEGQLNFEFNHLLSKLKIRNPKLYKELQNKKIEPHPIFEVVKGDIENWEIR